MARQGDSFDVCSHQVAAAVGAGFSVTDAAFEAGVSTRTVSRWLTRGRREPDSRFAAFAAAVEGARASAPLDGPMTDEEFELELAASIRKGNVQAMKIYADRLISERARARKGPEDALAFADELAARRGRHPEAS